MIPEIDDWTAMKAAHPTTPLDEPIVLDEGLTALLRALLCETRAPTLVAALEQARQAVATWAAAPSPLAVAGYCEEIVALKLRVELAEYSLRLLRPRYIESERRRVEAEEALRKIRLVYPGIDGILAERP